MSEHTPTPWQVSDHNASVWYEICGRMGELSANVKCKEDAEFIVCAVNSHEALVDAIKQVLKYGVHHEMADTLRAAVRKAEGLSDPNG